MRRHPRGSVNQPVRGAPSSAPHPALTDVEGAAMNVLTLTGRLAADPVRRDTTRVSSASSASPSTPGPACGSPSRPGDNSPAAAPNTSHPAATSPSAVRCCHEEYVTTCRRARPTAGTPGPRPSRSSTAQRTTRQRPRWMRRHDDRRGEWVFRHAGGCLIDSPDLPIPANADRVGGGSPRSGPTRSVTTDGQRSSGWARHAAGSSRSPWPSATSSSSASPHMTRRRRRSRRHASLVRLARPRHRLGLIISGPYPHPAMPVADARARRRRAPPRPTRPAHRRAGRTDAGCGRSAGRTSVTSESREREGNRRVIGLGLAVHRAGFSIWLGPRLSVCSPAAPSAVVSACGYVSAGVSCPALSRPTRGVLLRSPCRRLAVLGVHRDGSARYGRGRHGAVWCWRRLDGTTKERRRFGQHTDAAKRRRPTSHRWLSMTWCRRLAGCCSAASPVTSTCSRPRTAIAIRSRAGGATQGNRVRSRSSARPARARRRWPRPRSRPGTGPSSPCR